MKLHLDTKFSLSLDLWDMLSISACTHFPFNNPLWSLCYSLSLLGSLGSAESIALRPSRPYKHPRSSGRG